MERNSTWQLIYDESIDDTYGRYMGLIAPSCVEVIEKCVENKKKLKLDYYKRQNKKKTKKNKKRKRKG